MNEKKEIKKEVYSYLRNISLILFLFSMVLILYLGGNAKKVLLWIGISFYPILIILLLIPIISLILFLYSMIKLKKIKKEGDKK